MNWPADASNWMDVIDHVLVVAGAILLAAVPGWLAAVRNHKGIQEIKTQVVNGHKDPLRFDLDRAIAAIEELGRDVRGIREDLATEEDRRRKQIAELRDDMDRRHH